MFRNKKFSIGLIRSTGTSFVNYFKFCFKVLRENVVASNQNNEGQKAKRFASFHHLIVKIGVNQLITAIPAVGLDFFPSSMDSGFLSSPPESSESDIFTTGSYNQSYSYSTPEQLRPLENTCGNPSFNGLVPTTLQRGKLRVKSRCNLRFLYRCYQLPPVMMR